MGNLLTSNPMTVDTAAVLWDGSPKSIRMIQWLDDNEDIANSDDLSIIINGATIAMKIQMTADEINNMALWTFGPFSPGIPASYCEVVTIDHGLLVVVVN